MERQMATQAKQNGGIYFDDLRVGDQHQTPGRTVTETDVVNFAGLSADYNSLHVDAEFAKGLDFGQRVAHGLLILTMGRDAVNQRGETVMKSVGKFLIKRDI